MVIHFNHFGRQQGIVCANWLEFVISEGSGTEVIWNNFGFWFWPVLLRFEIGLIFCCHSSLDRKVRCNHNIGNSKLISNVYQNRSSSVQIGSGPRFSNWPWKHFRPVRSFGVYKQVYTLETSYMKGTFVHIKNM